MTKYLLFLLSFAVLPIAEAQVVLDADGPGDTYELINSILAPDYDAVEEPDCNHESFGRHIDEVFDEELDKYVFRFMIHTAPDNDRCINFDRQRNEIKTYDKSPENLLGRAGEKVVYRWQFKLSDGFQSSPNFTHLHQLKSVGGDLASMPMYTLTARKGSPDRIELRYAETDDQVTVTQTPLAPFIGTWLEATETIRYGTSGTYEIEIKKLSDDSILLAYSDDSIINWRPDADFVRPKWGIYRSLINDQDLRDEMVLFANFSIEEIETVSSENADINDDLLTISPNPVKGMMQLKNLSPKIHLIQLFGLDGKKLVEKNTNSATEFDLNVSSLPNGTYILNVKGEQVNQSKFVLILSSKG